MAGKQSEIMMVVSGEIHLKLLGLTVKTLAVGAMLGEEPLSSSNYQFTAECASAKALILTISLADYVTHFFRGCIPKPEPTISASNNWAKAPVCPWEVENNIDGLESRAASKQPGRRLSVMAKRRQSIADGHSFQSSLSKDKTDALLESLAGPTRRHRDKCNLMESEWRTMRSKHPLRVAPAG